MNKKENNLLLENTDLWKPVSPEDNEAVRALCGQDTFGGWRSLRIVGTFVGVIFVLSRVAVGSISFAAWLATLVLAGNIFVGRHAKREARDIAEGGLYTARGVCVGRQVSLPPTEDHFSQRCFGIFRMEYGSQYTIEVTQTYFDRMVEGSTTVFVKRQSGRGGLDYLTQGEIDRFNTAEDGQT